VNVSSILSMKYMNGLKNFIEAGRGMHSQHPLWCIRACKSAISANNGRESMQGPRRAACSARGRKPIDVPLKFTVNVNEITNTNTIGIHFIGYNNS
jgi:hypothetical protein